MRASPARAKPRQSCPRLSFARVEAPLPIAVLVSGTGTNLQALLDTVHSREAEIVAVAANVADRALADWLLERGARLVVLAGYMELIGDAFLSRFPRAVINVHPSLLPAFPGLHAVEQALAYGVKVFGVTVHFVDSGIDTGPVIAQRAVELPHARTPDEVLSVLHPIEHELLARAVRLFAQAALETDPENPRRIVAAPSAG